VGNCWPLLLLLFFRLYLTDSWSFHFHSQHHIPWVNFWTDFKISKAIFHMSILFVLFSHSFRELFVRTADVCLFSSFRLLLHLSEAEHLAVGTFSDLKSIPVEFRIVFCRVPQGFYLHLQRSNYSPFFCKSLILLWDDLISKNNKYYWFQMRKAERERSPCYALVIPSTITFFVIRQLKLLFSRSSLILW
jgi:hypothetical protein